MTFHPCGVGVESGIDLVEALINTGEADLHQLDQALDRTVELSFQLLFQAGNIVFRGRRSHQQFLRS
jgi:hypothetical protein